ncbi:LysM peptidoglycan-binding domain-containing protein [Xanthomonas massiliensis]|jgi:nucleoid-associated protein YgaU|uniref:LysM peptidoglycan-binding domain-containing protein n=1 Tax=Xanthomonas massiliensis TaxID=1720302 RepID=UPI000826AA54|nr:LysM peptidoglycan-binding domain-containing protein [Xanthomonas massiliensis]
MSNEEKADFSGVSAKVDSTAEPAKKADFSGVSASVDSTAQAVGEQQYTVKAGDSLSKIAKHFYGDGNAWKRIFEANQDTLKDPDKVYPGQVLKVPPKA